MKFIVWFLILLFFNIKVNAENNILTLSDGLNKLNNFNKNIDIVKLNKKIIQLEKNIIKSGYYPQINMSLNQSWTEHEIAKASMGFVPESKTDFKIELYNTIYNDKLNSNTEINKKNIDIFEIKKNELINNLAYNFVKLYFQILNLNELKNNQILNIKRIKSHIKHTETQYKAGLINQENVLRWKAELSNNNLKLKNIEIQIFNFKKNICFLLDNRISPEFEVQNFSFSNPGIFKNIINKLKDLNSSENRIRFKNNFFQQILNNNFNYKILKSTLEIKTIEKNSLSREYYIPEIGIGVNYENLIDEKTYKTPSAIKQPDNHNFSGIISATLPLFDGHRKKFENKKINKQILILRKQEKLLKNNLENRLDTIINDLCIIQEKIDYAETSYNYLKQTYYKIKDKYDKGLIEIVSLVDVQNSLFISKNQITINQYEYMNKIIDLYNLLSEVNNLNKNPLKF